MLDTTIMESLCLGTSVWEEESKARQSIYQKIRLRKYGTGVITLKKSCYMNANMLLTFILASIRDMVTASELSEHIWKAERIWVIIIEREIQNT